MNSHNIIFHVDMDAFFASCEEVKNPHFRGKPVVVGADPEVGHGRGVVSTANYEARKYGIHSAMPISRAWQLCPFAVFLPVNGKLYHAVSEDIMRILKKYSPTVEQVSVDEAYFKIKSKEKNLTPKMVAEKIRKEIYNTHEITCSIGIASNKLVAKVASDHQKPNGLTIVNNGAEEEFLAPLDIKKLPGIGPKTALIFNKMGVRTIGELQKLSAQILLDKFGKRGEWLFMASHGQGETDIISISPAAKSLGEEHTFSRDTADMQQLVRTLFGLIDSVCANLQHRWFRTITIIVRYEGFVSHSKAHSEEFPRDVEYVKKESLKLLWPFLQKGKKVRLLGFRISNFI